MSDLLPCPFCGGEETIILNGPVEHGWCAVSCDECHARGPIDYTDPHAIAAWNRRAAIPARGVKPLIFSEFKEGGCMGRPHPFQYFITQAHNGRFLCHHDETWHETLEAAQAHAQVAYQIAALSPAAQPGEDVEAQAREAALAVLAGLSSYLGTGLGDDDTTAEQFDKRIRWAIDDLTARTRQAALREAMTTCDYVFDTATEAGVAVGAHECRTKIKALMGVKP